MSAICRTKSETSRCQDARRSSHESPATGARVRHEAVHLQRCSSASRRTRGDRCSLMPLQPHACPLQSLTARCNLTPACMQPDACSTRAPVPSKPECCSLTPACSLMPAHCSLMPAHCSLMPARCTLTPACSLVPAHCSLMPARCSLMPARCTLTPALQPDACRLQPDPARCTRMPARCSLMPHSSRRLRHARPVPMDAMLEVPGME